MDASRFELRAKAFQQTREAAVHVKWRRESQRRCDLGGRTIVLEAQGEEKPVGRCEPVERPLQCAMQLGQTHLRFRTSAFGRTDGVGVYGLGGEVHQAASRCPVERRLGRVGTATSLRSSISPAMEIDAESPRNDEEPRGEPSVLPGGIDSQASTVLVSQLLEYEAVRIHRAVAVGRRGPRDLQNQRGVRINELAPRSVDSPGIARFEQACECRRERVTLGRVVSRHHSGMSAAVTRLPPTWVWCA